MVKEELIARSPVRIFMDSINGGLKPGEMGVVASPSGLGKTSVLVQIALDKLLQGKKVIHVSFTQHTDYVISWYENIFDEFTKKKNLEDEKSVRDEAVKNRVLMKFNQYGMSGEQIRRSIQAMIEGGGFKAEALIIDGFAFDDKAHERLAGVRDFAKEAGLLVWYSCAVEAGRGRSPGGELYDKRNIPLALSGSEDLFDVIVTLEPRPDHIALKVVKDRSVYNPARMSLRLDPRTLLILE